MAPKKGGKTSDTNNQSTAGNDDTNNGQTRTTPTAKEQRDRIDAFRRSLYPYVVERPILEYFLSVNDWNVDAAAKAYRAVRANHLAFETGDGDSDAGDDTPRDFFERSRVRWNNNPEQERRDAALGLQEWVRDRFQQTRTLSRAEASMWMGENQWDFDMARASYLELTHDKFLRQLARRFDHMREKLPMTADDKKPAKRMNDEDKKRQAARDERLAEFINITGRPDWYSLLVFLEEREFDLVRAVHDWHVDGVPPYTGQPRRNNVDIDGMRMGTDGKRMEKPTPEACVPRKEPAGDDSDGDDSDSSSSSSDSNWASEKDAFLPSDSDDDDDMSQNSSTPSSPSRNRADGFVIDDYPDTAKGSAPNPRRFIMEYISKGKYNFNIFKKESDFYWPERGEKKPEGNTKRTLFDWENQRHVNLLNNWWRQNRQRVLNTVRRESTQKWSKEELDFLYSLMKELLEEVKKKNPNKTEAELIPLKVSNDKKKEWQTRINEKFVGKILPGSKAPRRPREASALMTQRGRTRAIIDDFKVPKDKAYFAQQEAKKKKQQGKGKKQVGSPAAQSLSGEEEEEEPDTTLATLGGPAAGDSSALPATPCPTSAPVPRKSKTPEPPATPSAVRRKSRSPARSASPVDVEGLQAAAYSYFTDHVDTIEADLDQQLGFRRGQPQFPETLRDALIQDVEANYNDGSVAPVLRDAIRALIQDQYQAMDNERSASQAPSAGPGPSAGVKRTHDDSAGDSEDSDEGQKRQKLDSGAANDDPMEIGSSINGKEEEQQHGEKRKRQDEPDSGDEEPSTKRFHE
jgi:phage regulator Rha-like protein